MALHEGDTGVAEKPFSNGGTSGVTNTTPDGISGNVKSKAKLFGRAFYESIGSPKVIVAPMVDQSEFAWRMLTRSFMTPETSKSLLAYTPMLHARLFKETLQYRDKSFQPLRSSLETYLPLDQQERAPSSELYLDGHPKIDRPLFVQFCANEPDELAEAARYVQPFCDAVDLNLGCPQGIARKGHYGAFLQEDQDLIYRLIRRLHDELDIPVTAKIRILETREKTLEYAKKVLSAGASILTVHGRQREQKGHNTGVADWTVIRYLRDNLPAETVLFANGNILNHDDIAACMEATGADGVMSAEGNLHDPSIFAIPPLIGQEGREYWRGKDGKGGYRMDAVLRRYLDIIYRYVLETPAPERRPLFLPGDSITADTRNGHSANGDENGANDDEGEPPKKKQKKSKQNKVSSPNLTAMQAHLFNLLRPLVSRHTNVRDALARARPGDMAAFENVLRLTEDAVRQGITAYESAPADVIETAPEEKEGSSAAVIAHVRRPYWICQPYVRPLPQEAFEKGSMTLSKKERARQDREKELAKQVGVEPEGKTEVQTVAGGHEKVEVPAEGLVCC